MGMVFEWDEAKDLANQKKHGLGFDKAIIVFTDPFRKTRQDRVEGGEVRWQTVGSIGGLKIVLVAHTIVDENDDEIIRIISARPVSRSERKECEKQAY